MSEEKIFKLVSPYQPTGDQPQAIAQLVQGSRRETSVRHFLGLPVQVRHLRWQMSFSS